MYQIGKVQYDLMQVLPQVHQSSAYHGLEFVQDTSTIIETASHCLPLLHIVSHCITTAFATEAHLTTIETLSGRKTRKGIDSAHSHVNHTVLSKIVWLEKNTLKKEKG